MIDWISNWARGIVITVIVSTIIEMILPNNNSKKYIKIIIGIFIVYAIVEPFSSNNSGNGLEDLILDGEKSVNASVECVFDTDKINEKNNNAVLELYSENLKKDIESRLKSTGYVPDKINVSIKKDGTYDVQGVSVHIKEKSSNLQNGKNAQSIVDSVKDIIVKVEGSKVQSSVINKYDVDNIKKFFKSNYNIDENNVNVT